MTSELPVSPYDKLLNEVVTLRFKCGDQAYTIKRLQAQISALEQPTPEMVEAVARAIDATRSENDTIYDYAKAALAVAATHLKDQ